MNSEGMGPKGGGGAGGIVGERQDGNARTGRWPS